MIEVSIDRADLRTWLVCEADERWVTAVRRFAPILLPPPLVPRIIDADAATTNEQVVALGDQPTIVLWESCGESLLPVCDRLIQTAAANPRTLQLVAAPNRSAGECEVLSELPCTAILRHPEDLAGLASMVRAYFHADGRSRPVLPPSS